MAKDINKQIEDRIRAFADELNDLVRQAAVDAVSDALGTASPRAASTASRPRRVTRGRRRAGGGRGRRSPGQMAGTMTDIRDFIASHPGARMEQMTAALGQPAARLRGPVNKLLEDGALRKTGEKRATQYYPAAGGGRKKTTRKKRTTRKKASRKKAGRKKSTRKRRG